MSIVWGIGGLAIGLGVWWLVGGLRRLPRKPAAAMTRLLGGAVAGVTGVGTLMVGVNLQSYQRLTHEQPVAKLQFSRDQPQQYSVKLQRTDTGAIEQYQLYGDEWQLDARVIKWQGPAIVAGMDARYQLDRLGGRFADVREEISRERSVYNLAKQSPIDLWSLAREHPNWLAWVDAGFGSATYLPMADGAQFAVHLTQTGLLARPINTAGEQAVQNWK